MASPKKTTEENNNNDAFHTALDDVHTRFILNLPSMELSTSDRIFFQLEQAYWFFDDFYCDKQDKSDNVIPRFRNLRHFSQKMFEISPLLYPKLSQFDEMWDEFSSYRRKISTYGTILLNKACTKVVLCQDWNGKFWTFPAGKVNQNETGTIAGSRETYEETGFDISCQLGRTRLYKKEDDSSNTDNDFIITWKDISGDDALVYTEQSTGKRRTCYVCHGIPEDFPFEPVARKEVSDVQWFDLNNLPKKTYAVLPFISQLRKWIRKRGFLSEQNNQSTRQNSRGRSSSQRSTQNGIARNVSNNPTKKSRQRKIKNQLLSNESPHPNPTSNYDKKLLAEDEKVISTYDGDAINVHDIMNFLDGSLLSDGENSRGKMKSNQSTVAQKLKEQQKKDSTINSKVDDWKYLKDWVRKLDRPGPTPYFGSFNFDVNAIMKVVIETSEQRIDAKKRI